VSFETPKGSLSWSHEEWPRRLSRAGKLLFLVSSAGVPLFALVHEDLAGVVLMIVGAVYITLFVVSYLISLVQTHFAGTLAVDVDALHVRKGAAVRTIPLASIAGALVVERAGAPAVEIELARGDRLTARFADVAVTRALVDSLGFGPRGRRVRVHLATPLRRLTHLAWAFFAYTIGSVVSAVAATLAAPLAEGEVTSLLMWATLPFATLAIYEVTKRLLAAPTVTVGDDGVRIERAMGARSYPLRSDLRSSRYLWVDRPRVEALTRLAAERAGPIARGAHAIDQRAAFARSSDPSASSDRTKPFAAWSARLGELLGSASYRGAPVTADDARATLRSPDATPEERVGAALALRVAGDAPSQIRVASESLADPRLRVAIEAIADGDDARAEAALGKLQRRGRRERR
jgi:hypothetical protein